MGLRLDSEHPLFHALTPAITSRDRIYVWAGAVYGDAYLRKCGRAGAGVWTAAYARVRVFVHYWLAGSDLILCPHR